MLQFPSRNTYLQPSAASYGISAAYRHFLLVLLIIFTFNSKLFTQCNTDVSICEQGVAGPFTFGDSGPTDVTSCLDFIGTGYAYITLYITQSGPLEMLIQGDSPIGFLDVSVYSVPAGISPCDAMENPMNEIGCNYADFSGGCNQFGNFFPCNSSVPSPDVVAGDILIILVEDWSSLASEFTLELAPPPAAQTGPPDPIIIQPGDICNTSTSEQLTTTVPGGTWSGANVTEDGIFDASAAGIGNHTVTYSIGTDPCQAITTEELTVVACDAPTCCTYSLILQDQIGNGWGGSEVSVLVNNTLIETSTVYTDQNQFDFEACNGDNIELIYSSMGFDNPADHSFSLSLGPDIIFSSGFNPPNGTNYNNEVNCEIPICAIDMNFEMSECDQLNKRYNLSGTINYTDPPNTGQLIVELCNAQQVVFDAPFNLNVSNFLFENLNPNALPCWINAYFTDAAECSIFEQFVAPEPCCTDNIYSVFPPACINSCTGEISVDILDDFASPFDYTIIDQIDNSIVVSSENSGNNFVFSNLCTGNYILEVTDVNNCTSTNTFFVPPGEEVVNVTEDLFGCESVEVNGITYTTDQTVTNDYISSSGCDSIVVSNIYIYPEIPTTTNNVDICFGQTYTEGISIYSLAGTYYDVYAGQNNCDSTVITVLTVNPVLETMNKVEICNGESYFEQNSEYTTGGIYYDMYTSIHGCDSLVITDLSITEVISVTHEVNICPGESYSEGNNTYDQTGVYTDIYTSVSGCDSIVTTELAILETYISTQFIILCDGETWTEGQSIYDVTGVYENTYTSMGGCDSIVITDLLILETEYTTNDIEICFGSTYAEGNSIYDQPGTYTDVYQNIHGCDSLVVTNLSISEYVLHTNTISICDGDSYTEGNSTYYESGTYNDIYSNLNNCDSVVETILTVNATPFNTFTPTICPGEVYTEGISIYTSSGTYTDVYTSSLGCDSTVTTILTVLEEFNIENTVSMCVGETHFEGNSEYDSTGIYTDVYQSISGCDSTVTTLLTINPTKETNFSQIVCEGNPIPQFGAYFDENNNRFIDSLQTSTGCDSIVFNYLEFVNPEVILPTEISLCSGQSFVANIDGIEEGWTINWSTGNTTSSETFSEEGNYWVEIQSEHCSASDSISIYIHDPLTLSMVDVSICTDSEITLDLSTEDGIVSWNDGTENNVLTINEAGIYTAQIMNACGSYTYSAFVEEENCNCKIYVPNAFTADGDNLNELFTVSHDCNFIEYEFLIFNRWGEVVFKTEDPNESWVGNSENGEYYVPEGVYSYLVKYTSRDENNRAIADKMYGSVTIIR